MKDIEELDRLHAAATAGEWLDHGDDSVRWDDPMACGYDSREHHRGPPYYCTGPRCKTVEQAEADASTVVALHNAWPAFSARLRAAEAECERLRALCRDAAEHIDPMRWGHGTAGERALVARLDRAALGEP